LHDVRYLNLLPHIGPAVHRSYSSAHGALEIVWYDSRRWVVDKSGGCERGSQLLVECLPVAGVQLGARDALERVLRVEIEREPCHLGAVPALEPLGRRLTEPAEGSDVVRPDRDEQRLHGSRSTSGRLPAEPTARPRRGVSQAHHAVALATIRASSGGVSQRRWDADDLDALGHRAGDELGRVTDECEGTLRSSRLRAVCRTGQWYSTRQWIEDYKDSRYKRS